MGYPATRLWVSDKGGSSGWTQLSTLVSAVLNAREAPRNYYLSSADELNALRPSSGCRGKGRASVFIFIFIPVSAGLHALYGPEKMRCAPPLTAERFCVVACCCVEQAGLVGGWCYPCAGEDPGCCFRGSGGLSDRIDFSVLSIELIHSVGCGKNLDWEAGKTRKNPRFLESVERFFPGFSTIGRKDTTVGAPTYHTCSEGPGS